MSRPLVIVGDLHLVGITLAPFEADAPLIVDANAVLPGPITGEFLQTIAPWDLQVGQLLGCIQDQEFPEGCTLRISAWRARISCSIWLVGPLPTRSQMSFGGGPNTRLR
jgi:hypothetical protein